MKRRVFWSRDALDELKQIARHIAQDNPPAARRVAAAIRQTGSALGERAIGRKGRVTGTYEKSVTGIPYIVAYTISALPDNGEAVYILRVIHTSRQWEDESWPPV